MREVQGESVVASSRELSPERGGGVGRLVAQELRRTWLSYVATAFGNVFFGLLAASTFWTAARLNAEGQRFGVPNFETDLIFLLLVSLLSLNWISRSYAMVWEDPFSRWLGFLRTLPVPVREIVTARAAVMVGVTVVMTGVFFVPFYALNSPGNPMFTETIPMPEYLWFAGIWLGYALLLGGPGLYLELGVRGKMMLWIQIAVVVAILAVLSVLTGLGVHLVWGSFRLVELYGPLPALAAITIGLAGMALGHRATVRRLRTRSFPS